MNNDTSLQSILRRLVARGTDPDWRAFLERFHARLAGVYRGAERSHFHDWLTSWLWENRVPEKAWRAYLRRTEDRPFADAADADRFLEAYLLKAARNAIKDFRAEQEGSSRALTLEGEPDQDPWQNVAATSSPDDNRLQRLRDDLLPHLPDKHRIAITLAFYRELGPLPQVDLDLLAGIHERTAEEIDALVRDAYQPREDTAHVFSAAEIAALMGEPVDPTGRYCTVAQWISRARRRLREDAEQLEASS